MKKIKVFLVALPMMLALQANAQLVPVYFDNPADALRDRNKMTNGQREFFEAYDYAMEQVNEGQSMEQFFVMEKAKAGEPDSISPLLEKKGIRYGQDAPYNNKCPILNGGRAVTGCVATAMAQVMYYYEYPKVGTGTVTYTGGSDGAKTINLADYPFDWSNIIGDYSHSKFTTEQANAVATLMLACGAALNMNYSKDGSGSNTGDVPKVLKNNFGFDSNVAYSNATGNMGIIEDDWVYTIREELQKGHPIIYAGAPASGMSGHCFVIDGYKLKDGIYYYHLNWGWDGAYNGDYLIMNLKPNGESYSGANCSMVYGIMPPNWTPIENTEADAVTAKAKKVVRDGQVVIVRGDKAFSVLGTEL